MMRRDEPATMMHLIRPLLLLLGVVVLLLLTEHALGDAVRIHDVTGSDGPDVLLSQVAELDGDYANQFADVIVGRFSEGETRVEIEASAILEAMRAGGAKLGLLDLRGFSKCTVHRTATQSARVEATDAENAITNVDNRAGDIDGRASGEPVTVHTPTTVRALIERTIRKRIGVDGTSLEITFNDKDAELLRSSAVAGRYEAEPVAEPTLGRVSFKVYAFNGTQRVGNGRLVTAEVARRVIAVVAGETIDRGELINRRQVRLREVLIDDARQVYLPDTSLVVGQVASQKITPGRLITAGEVELPVAVRRRERVSVELKTRGIKITFNGMAKEQGAVGDVIEIENIQTKERFRATVVARGRVVAGEKIEDNKEDKP